VSDRRRLSLVAGARPNFMKLAPVLRVLRERGAFEVELVHTGQHYDEAMSDAFFADLGMPSPDAFLGVGSGTHAEQTARIMVAFEAHVARRRPDMVIVFGDVNSTLGCSVVAAKGGVRVAHVEAGLRSGDRSMPEEINRIVTDALAELCFTTSDDADANLRREGHRPEEIHLVGNTMIDTLEEHRERVTDRAPLSALGVPAGEYIVVTLHRPSNVDDIGRLEKILGALASLPLPVVFPIHPRTLAAAQRGGQRELLDRLVVIPPTGYLDFLRLQTHARLVLTDSGGVQEESTVLGVRCLTLRDNTERPITISHGTNRLIGSDPDRIGPEVSAALAAGPAPRRRPPLWDGRASDRIADVLERSV
jgi:UDP-N-acetylglucosamine 2-epimerase (non-hydrolysing)